MRTETQVTTLCEFQQKRRDEPDQEGEVSDTYWDAFFNPGEDIATGDGLIVEGLEYEFVGDPWPARNPRTGVMSHIEATVRRVAGADDGGGS